MEKRSLKKHIFFGIFVLIVGILLIFAILSNDEVGMQLGSNLVRTETMYIIIALLILLPIIIFALAYFVARKTIIFKVNPLKRLFSKTKKNQGDENTRFYMLSKTDEKMSGERVGEVADQITLEKICEDFRNFSAYKLGLYYDKSDIRKFISGLAVSKIMVMQGMSGTGKTSLAFAFGEYLQNPSTIVPIQPMWKERTDLIGYYNEFTKKFNETTLLQKLYEANYSNKIYVTVLDEMNIARVEYYFAEFLSLLEIPSEEGRYLEVVSDEWDCDPKLFKDGKIKLPNNMWFIGTANNDDSTFAISDKVYDRAMIMNLDRKARVFDGEKTEAHLLTIDKWEELTKRAKKEYAITERNLRRIAELDKFLIKNYQLTFGNRIMKQLKEFVAVFVACGGSELEAIDDIMAKKVLRKLEAKNPVLVRNLAEATCDFIKQLFGEDNMTSCVNYLTNLEMNS